MNKPEMILFDYGQTLCCEPGFDLSRGYNALFEYIIESPNDITADELYKAAEDLFKDFVQCRKLGFEMHQQRALNCVFERLGIKFKTPMNELETILWNNTSIGAAMPYADEMLEYLNKRGIRTGVISNIGWSGEALTRRLNRILPENNFEFVIASSEYVVRKPDKRLFEVAIQKAKLPPDKIWYCGDSIKYDVRGAHGAGMQPVLYEGESQSPDPYPTYNAEEKIDFNYLHVKNWLELIDVLEKTE